MENLTNIFGLQNIAEEIFLNLDNESLVNCFKQSMVIVLKSNAIAIEILPQKSNAIVIMHYFYKKK